MNIIFKISLLSFVELAICIVNHNPRISAGDLVRSNNFKFQGQLLVNQNFICGAILISRGHLLTAAHKIEFLTKRGAANYSKEILLGSKRILTGFRYQIKRISYHKGFDQVSSTIYNNDISVIHLYKSVIINEYHAPINLPNENEEVFARTTVIASGFGKQFALGRLSDNLYKLQLMIVPLSVCQERMHPIVPTINQLCTLPNPGTGCGHGDEGGPLIKKAKNYTLLGIISVIPKDCVKGSPILYTKVSRYISYIQKEITYDIYDQTTWTDHPEANYA